MQLDHPFPFHANGGDGVNADATLEDVPGSTTTAAIYPRGSSTDGSVLRDVLTVTRSGLFTQWSAQSKVPLGTLRGWAFAAVRHDEG
jgi:hypothetical protein